MSARAVWNNLPPWGDDRRHTQTFRQHGSFSSVRSSAVANHTSSVRTIKCIRAALTTPFTLSTPGEHLRIVGSWDHFCRPQWIVRSWNPLHGHSGLVGCMESLSWHLWFAGSWYFLRGHSEFEESWDLLHGHLGFAGSWKCLRGHSWFAGLWCLFHGLSGLTGPRDHYRVYSDFAETGVPSRDHLGLQNPETSYPEAHGSRIIKPLTWIQTLMVCRISGSLSRTTTSR